MSDFIDKASLEQKEVIKYKQSNNTPLVVVAGAGSGKTTTIINRLGFQIEQKIIKAEEVLALSFSNKSAQEITNRVKQKLGENNTIGITTGTFHSIALKILKTHNSLYKNIKILDEDENKKYLKKYYNMFFGETIDAIKQEYKRGELDEEEYMYKLSKLSAPKDIMWCISRSKNTNENIFDIIFEKLVKKRENMAITRPQVYFSYLEILFQKEAYDKFQDTIIDFTKDYDLDDLDIFNIKYVIQTIKEYERNKIQEKYQSFDDLLISVVSFLNKNEIIRENLDDKYKYIYVDEFQDVNYIQFEFIKLLNKKNNYLFVVGDSDQAIYSFRGCDSYYFTNMKHIYPNTKLFFLSDNYRSDGHIVATANTLIENNTHRYDKTMKNIKEIKNVPTYMTEYTEDILFSKIVTEIEALKNYKETAILYRNNMHSLQIQKKLITKNIPFKVVGGQNLLNKKYIRDLISLLYMTINLDELSTERVITMYPKVGKKKANTVIGKIYVLKNKGNSYIEQLNILDTIKELKPLHKLLVGVFNDEISYKELLEKFYEDTIQNDMFKKVDGSKITNEMSSIEEFISMIDKLNTEGKDINNILDLIMLDNVEENNINDDNFVTLSTIHRSKGLEWDNIFIIKAYNKVFPSFNAMNTEFLLEEERNLFYVAITRAKEKLYIGVPAVIQTQFDTQVVSPSMFVNEIEEFLE